MCDCHLNDQLRAAPLHHHRRTQPGASASLYAETSAHWQKMAQACFAFGFPVVTSYASLGEEALVFSFNQARAVYHALLQI